MGQYHYLVNLDKKQVVHPHQIGNGLKMVEQVGWQYSTATVLAMLLAGSCKGGPRGGGDFRTGHPLVGSWAGDRVAFVGDYAEKDDVANVDAKDLYSIANAACYAEEAGEVTDKSWTNISPQVREMMSSQYGITYEGEGWLHVKEAGVEQPAQCPLKPDIILTAKA